MSVMSDETIVGDCPEILGAYDVQRVPVLRQFACFVLEDYLVDLVFLVIRAGAAFRILFRRSFLLSSTLSFRFTRLAPENADDFSRSTGQS